MLPLFAPLGTSHRSAYSYIFWRTAGKPRDHDMRFNMNIARLRFKRAFKACKYMEENARAGALAHSLQQHDFHLIWEHVRHSKNKSIPLVTTIDNCTGEENIG